MKTIVIMLLAVMTTGVGWALTTLPEGGTGVTPELEALLAEVKGDQEYIRIDDMDFRVETLRKSGFTGPPWPNGVVWYQFDASVNTVQRENWRDAAWMWTQVANLTFIEGVGPPPGFPHIFVYLDTSNHSDVGYQGDQQYMWLASWTHPYVIAHEIAHSLGFVHEQSRTDRDDYVEIVLGNIKDDKEYNFDIEMTTNLTPYDFDSMMHYPADAFILDELTCPPDCAILVKEPWHDEWQFSIGQRNHFSEWDMFGMATVYGASCEGPIYVDYWSQTQENGSYHYPFRLLSTAVDFACPGAEIRLFAGGQPFAPILIDKWVRLTAYGGSVLIE